MARKPMIRFMYVPKRGRNYISTKLRANIYERDRYTCQYCKRELERAKLSIEHVVPISSGGIDEIVNYFTVCRSCNSSKNAKPLIEYVKKHRNINIYELPIHGDIIIDTPELDIEYRELRRETYYKLRTENNLKGNNALKLIENDFNKRFWNSNYGKIYRDRFPKLPSNIISMVPLVEYIVPDTRKPIFNLLLEFCKSASTKILIDTIIRNLSNSNHNNSDLSIKSVLHSKYEESVMKRINQAKQRAKIKVIDDTIFQIPNDIKDSPVAPFDVLVCVVEKEEEGIGIAYLNDYPVNIMYGEKGREYKISVTNVKKCFCNAEIIGATKNEIQTRRKKIYDSIIEKDEMYLCYINDLSIILKKLNKHITKKQLIEIYHQLEDIERQLELQKI